MNEWYGVIVIVLTVVGSNTFLHRDIANLRERVAKMEERMARIEGIIQGFMAGSKGQELHG